MNIFDIAMMKKFGGGSGSGGGADWNASEGEAGYVKNRTHWTEVSRGVILPETTFVPLYNSSLGCTRAMLPLFKLELGKTYTVLFDGVEYNLSAFAGTTPFNFIAVGNTVFAGGENTGEPFAVAYLPDADECDVLCMDTDIHTVLVIDENKTIYHKIPDEYIANDYMVTVRMNNDGSPNVVNHIDDIIEAAEAGKNVYASFKWVANNPDGTTYTVSARFYLSYATRADDGLQAEILFVPQLYGTVNHPRFNGILIERNDNGIVVVKDWGT